MDLRQILAEILLLLPEENASRIEDANLKDHGEIASAILRGHSTEIVKDLAISKLFQSETITAILSEYPGKPLGEVLRAAASKIEEMAITQYGPENGTFIVQMLAVAMLQTFIQANFTGPEPDFASRDSWFPLADDTLVHTEGIRLLNIEGKSAYDMMNEPVLLVMTLLIFEHLMKIPSGFSLVGWNHGISLEELTEITLKNVSDLGVDSPINASLVWWRSRALQVHLSVISEPSDILASVTSALLHQKLVNTLVPQENSHLELRKHLQLIFLLECARNRIHSQTEHLAEPLLKKAANISQLQFVLTGAKAKRTKFQNFHTASLILLAKSTSSKLFANSSLDAPEAFDLNSDLLLEKPQYESLEDLDMTDSKRIKLDFEQEDHDSQNGKLLPTAATQDDIPSVLRQLDPNNQPTLTDLDNIQLLLRLTTIRQTSPMGNPLVEEELSAVVNRIVYSSLKSINWLVFSRALWERSVLETTKARTVERGILQMTSLVEEIGLKIQSRVLPQEENESSASVSSRIRFIHQMPLIARWSLDAKLAEKYMSLGVLKSAIAIYERLGMVSEAALCYAAVDEEKQAEKMLMERIHAFPDDARAISILGDIRQDPQLWEKAWEIGHYSKAKASLSKYYYARKDLAKAIDHMHSCLSVSPLSFENWFFYGCCGLETQQFELAAEAFTRCVSLDDNNSHAWSNLATALLKLDKTKQAFNALKRALQQGEGASRSWRIFENYLTVAAKLGEWNDVLHATKELLKIKGSDAGETAIDLPVIETLVQILVEEPYPTVEELESGSKRLTHFQKSCMDLVCNILPSLITSSARCWRLVSRVELWRNRPWAALECHEKAYRALASNPDLNSNESIFSDAVDACSDLVSAYESLGELPGKHGADDLVCKDWKYKSRLCVRSLMSKAKSTWEDTDGWDRLLSLKENL